MHDNVMIICLKDAPLKRIKQLDPDITVAYCMFIAWSDVEKIDFTDNVSIEEGNITPDLVQKLHKEGKKVFCWTVDEEDTIQYLVSCGVDVIGTDNPMMVVNALDKVEYSGGLTRCFNIIMNSIANMGR
jgi:glycerophosphoryl diester phosphodiesterase